MNNRIKCPICGKELWALDAHMRVLHKLNAVECVKLYPETRGFFRTTKCGPRRVDEYICYMNRRKGCL
jgi:ribosomal protein S27E